MEGHQFTPVLKDEGTQEEYRKCQRCGAVSFERNDPLFNMFCQSAQQDRENLRARLRG